MLTHSSGNLLQGIGVELFSLCFLAQRNTRNVAKEMLNIMLRIIWIWKIELENLISNNIISPY